VSLAIKWKAPTETIRHKPRCIWNYKDAACEFIQTTNWDSLLSDGLSLSTWLWTQGNLWKSMYLTKTWKDVEIFHGWLQML